MGFVHLVVFLHVNVAFVVSAVVGAESQAMFGACLGAVLASHFSSKQRQSVFGPDVAVRAVMAGSCVFYDGLYPLLARFRRSHISSRSEPIFIEASFSSHLG